ncbi:unnamed protein product [Microthlaspi erraticum]|uniref:Uncharacterized protein n=1 Tax=Microthlaspi erraticum TaxID=1685480 RepID=A0A6D2I614_9BRAS|nr:unnamed protein product [Microthlaspi erraticum]
MGGELIYPHSAVHGYRKTGVQQVVDGIPDLVGQEDMAMDIKLCSESPVHVITQMGEKSAQEEPTPPVIPRNLTPSRVSRTQRCNSSGECGGE